MSYIIIVIIYNGILSWASESNSFLCAWKIQSPPATKKLYGCIQPSGMPSWPNTSTIFSFRFLTAPHWHRYFQLWSCPSFLELPVPKENASLRCAGGSSLSWWKLVSVGVPFLGHIYPCFFCEVIPIISTTCWSKHVFVVAIEIISFLGSLHTFRDMFMFPGQICSSLHASTAKRFGALILCSRAIVHKMGEHGRTCRVCPDYWGPHTPLMVEWDLKVHVDLHFGNSSYSSWQ